MGRHVRRQYEIVTLSRQVIKQAIDLLEKHPLRAYDAVQLASALDANNRLAAAGLQPLVFMCADRRLLSVAGAEGLPTEEPH